MEVLTRDQQVDGFDANNWNPYNGGTIMTPIVVALVVTCPNPTVAAEAAVAVGQVDLLVADTPMDLITVMVAVVVLEETPTIDLI